MLEVGTKIARRNNQRNRLSLPVSVKFIQLDGEDYARFYDGKVSYGFNISGNRLTLGQKISYRDYQRFNEGRENALLLKSSLSLIHPISASFSLNAQLAFTLLDTENQLYRSYDRFKTGLGLKYKAHQALNFGIGGLYQTTDYKGTFNIESCIEEEEEDEEFCAAVDLDDGMIRQDDYTSIYLNSRLKLNENWSIKGRMSKSKRHSSQDRYEYKRTTFSAGLYMKF